MSEPQLKEQLITLSQEELIAHILELDKKFKTVRDYHRLVWNKDVIVVLEKFYIISDHY